MTAKGYGNALMAGITAACGRYIIMGDADDSYDFLEIPRFVEKLRQGYELVQGCRLPSGGVAPALCAGAAALARGDHTEAARLLEAALHDLPRIGGSHAQREVAEDSLIVALLRSGQSEKAARLLRSRLGRRPSARDEAWLAVCSSRIGTQTDARRSAIIN